MIYTEQDIRFEIRSLSDDELEQEFIAGDSLAGTIMPLTLRRDFQRWRREIESEVRRRKPASVTVPDNWQMYTDRANQAVATAIFEIARRVEAGEFHSESAFLTAVEAAFKAVAKKHAEIHDTEPRGMVRDWADMIGDKQGWNTGRYDYGTKTGDRLAL